MPTNRVSSLRDVRSGARHVGLGLLGAKAKQTAQQCWGGLARLGWPGIWAWPLTARAGSASLVGRAYLRGELKMKRIVLVVVLGLGNLMLGCGSDDGGGGGSGGKGGAGAPGTAGTAGPGQGPGTAGTAGTPGTAGAPGTAGTPGSAGAGGGIVPDASAPQKCTGLLEAYCGVSADCITQLNCDPGVARDAEYQDCLAALATNIDCSLAVQVAPGYDTCISDVHAIPCSAYGAPPACMIADLPASCTGVILAQ